MPHYAWLLPAHVLNDVAMLLVWLMSWLVLARHPSPYFRWWVASSGLAAFGAPCFTIHEFLWPLDVFELLCVISMPFSAAMMIVSARCYRERRPWPRWLVALTAIGFLAVTLPRYFGLSEPMIAVPGIVMLTLSRCYFGWIFLPRGPKHRDARGAYLVGFAAIAWGMLEFTYPVFVLSGPRMLAMGFATFGMINLVLGMGMIVHLYEQSHVRAQDLDRQVSLANLALHQTIEALSDTRTEAQLSAAVAREQEALVRQIIHDLRNATQAIALMTEEIEDAAGDNPAVVKAVGALDRQVRFISTFLKEKLAWIVDREAVAEAGTEVSQAFEALYERFSMLATSKRQTLVIEPMAKVGLVISAVQFAQILGNLLSNAHQHCPEGTHITVRMALSDGWATFYVIDDGPGISATLQGSLGREPQRADGRGIGIKNVQDLVSANGGLFGVVSEEGSGSTFYVTLPLVWWGLRMPGDRGAIESLAGR